MLIACGIIRESEMKEKNFRSLHIISIILSLALFSCAVKDETIHWNVIWLDEMYSIKVPSDWVVTTIEGKLIFSDRNLNDTQVRIYMMQVDTKSNSPTDKVIFTGPQFYGVDGELKNSEMRSNGTFLEVYTINVNSQSEDYRVLIINLKDARMSFVVIDQGIDKRILNNILASKTIK